MFGQSVSAADVPTIGALILLEGLLSADNAMVLAIMVKHLPGELQRRALLYGLGGAFIMRMVMIALATIIIQFWWLQLIGAAYLVWLPLKHFWMHSQGSGPKNKGAGFWMTVVQVELIDLAFALDSVLAGVALVNTARHPDKTWVVVAGGLLGVIILRFAAGVFINLLQRYPSLDHLAYALVGWAGVKMITVAGHTYHHWATAVAKVTPVVNIPEMTDTVFWIGMAVISAVGVTVALRQGPSPVTAESQQMEAIAEEVEEIMEGEDDPNRGVDVAKR